MTNIIGFMKTTYLLISLFILSLLSCSEQTSQEWFPFTPSNNFEAGKIGMESWLDAPAGKHGFVQMDSENLRFEDGNPIKFWGTNICSHLPYVEAEKADSFVNFLAKYGVNAVRFHKFSWYAYHGDKSTEFDPEKFKPFDYFNAALREKGIYQGWSHIYGHKVQPGDSSKMLAYQEIKNLKYPWAHLNGSTSSLVNFAPDLQDLNIALTVDMLNHVNPHTGLRYADDPALAFIEFQNEDNIFWGAIERSLEQAPTYRKLLCEQFSEWLIDKYRTQSNLKLVWGKGTIPEGESLNKKNIYPQPNHGLFSGEYSNTIKENRPMAKHILDKMQFLYETQIEFYKKFEKAVRETGYKGVLVGSCWQAGSGISHFYNLHADYTVGMIDRHNYFGEGAGGHRLDTGRVRNASMLANPGSGLLGAGMQQVINRPFSFSEWMSLVPNQWTAEATSIIAVYGMGLQGWDASFSFATDIPRYSKFLESERHGVYNATSPLHMGLYPALARMVYRSDIKESPVIATRNIYIPSLQEGELGFNEYVRQGYDDKSFFGTFSPKMLAIGRIPVKFTENDMESALPDISPYWDEENNIITSSTNELTWEFGETGFFTINTKNTKGVVGFIPENEVKLGDWTFSTKNKFAVILLTSLEKDKSLDKSNGILLTTVARGKNTGMEYTASGDTLLKKGTNPLLLEPVNLSLKTPKKYSIEILDQDGQSTGNMIEEKGGKIQINGAENKTIWYVLRKSN